MNLWRGYPNFRKDLVQAMSEDMRRGSKPSLHDQFGQAGGWYVDHPVPEVVEMIEKACADTPQRILEQKIKRSESAIRRAMGLT
jgi:hypothetical protein